MGQASRDEVARTVAAEPGRLRRASAAGVLALLAASALAPVATAVLGGGAVGEAIAGIAGNVGSGYLTELIQKTATRLRRGSAGSKPREAFRDALASDLLRELEKNDAAARELATELVTMLNAVDGLDAAVAAAHDDLRGHLVASFGEIADQQRTALAALRAVGDEQRRQGRALRRQADLLEEIADRLRRNDTPSTHAPGVHAPDTHTPGIYMPGTHAPGADSRAPASVPSVCPTLVAAVPQHAPSEDWRGGGDVAVGERVYLLYDLYLEERPSADHALVRRQAQAQLLGAPASAPDRYAWLRQVEVRRRTPAAVAALDALVKERDLLRDLGRDPGLPRFGRFAEGRIATLALVWPTSRSTRVACETLDVLLDGSVPLDPWRLGRLCDGLAGLCRTLGRLHRLDVAHRELTPSGIIMRTDGGLVLRDLGLAAAGHVAGEGPADYQAPEQRRRGRGRPGPPTDVYQVGAVAYHLISGHPPHATTPPPVRALAPGVPESLGRVVDAALAADPAERPHLRELGAGLKAARRDLSGFPQES